MHVEYAHRLVAEAWIPVPQRYLDAGYTMDTLEVNHKDGNTHNNAVSNLEWVTRLGNAKHAYENNLHQRSHNDEDLETIWKLLSEGKTNKEISELTGVPSPTISSIRHKRGLATALGIQRHEVQKLSKKLNLHLISTKAASLDEDTLHTIFNYLQEGKSNREISQLVNIDIQSVNNIRIRQRYADKSVGYTWPENDTAC